MKEIRGESENRAWMRSVGKQLTFPAIQAMTTRSGRTKMLIWIELPTATAMDKSSLSLTATVTAVTCSAAFETMGRRMRPIHVLGGAPGASATPSIASTSHSEVTPTRTVARISRPMAVPVFNCGSSSSESLVKRCLCEETERCKSRQQHNQKRCRERRMTHA